MLLTSLLACAAVALPPAQEPALREPRSPGAPLVEITEEQERAVERGLAWLATRQDATGGWSSDVGFKLNSGYRATALDRGHVGVSALAGMAFLAGGHVAGRGEYGAVIERCLDFVLGCVQEDGYVTNAGTRMYSHAFATLFLAEIYGMTHRQDVRSKLQAAVDFIVRSQNPEGGWRYVPLARESDMSIVVCQVLALRAARKQLGLTQPELALAAGVGVRFIVDLEAGKPTLRLANVLRVIDALGGELQLSGLPSSVLNGEGEGVPVSGRLGERGNGT